MSKFTTILSDAKNKVLALIRVDESNVPLVDDTLGSVLIRLGLNPDDPFDGSNGDDLRIFGVHFTDTSGNKKWASALVSAPIDDTTSGPSDPLNSPSDWWIGGGGGGVQRFRVKSVQGDHMTCRAYGDRVVASAAVHGVGSGYVVGNVLTVSGGTGASATLTVTMVSAGAITGVSVTTGGLYTADPPTAANAVTGGAGAGATMDLTMGGGEGDSDILIAKPPEIRQSLATEVVEHVTWSYTWSARSQNSDGQRAATATGHISQTHIVEPVYRVNADSDGYSEIWADQPTGGTGVSVSGTPLVWMDTNRAGRCMVMVA